MKRTFGLCLTMLAASGCFCLLSSPAARGAEEVGEVSIRNVIPLNTAQRAALSGLVKADSEASALLAERVEEMKSILSDTPRPLSVIRYEGRVHTDPQRMEDVVNLRDMDKIALLFEVWQATGSTEAAAKIREFSVAWADTYQPTGNDVNENKLIPLLVAYGSLRETFSEEEQSRVDAWMNLLAQGHIRAVQNAPEPLTNRYTKRLIIVAVLAGALHQTEWLEVVETGFKRFVSASLFGDGSSQDFKHRDTLTYHSSALRPLLDLAVLFPGKKLYDWESPEGGSVKKSVEFVVPYVRGEKTHAEWVNSVVELDRQRAAAGLEAYRIGRPFEPKSALRMLEQAAYFDPALQPLVIQLSGGTAKRFPTWRSVLNAAVQSAPAL